MKKNEKSAGDGTWFARDNRGGRYCDYPVATSNPGGRGVGEPGSNPRKALRRRYAKLSEAKAVSGQSFKAWLRAGA